MTNRIDDAFGRLREAKRTALIAYVMAGYPSGTDTADVILRIAEAGADIIEVGIPFSDPLADGATIQKASQFALDAGMTTDRVLEAVAKARQATAVPILIMTYFNVVMRYGLERFAVAAGAAGVDGAILPDLPPEEADVWLAASNHGLNTVFLVAPTSSEERKRRAAEASTGFVYCVALTGVTGGRKRLDPGLPAFIESVRKTTDKPIAVGFGVSTTEHVKTLSNLADGVIVGSALIDRMSAGGREGLASAAEFLTELKTGLSQ